MSVIPLFIVCARNTVADTWCVELYEVNIAAAVANANALVSGGAHCACVMEVGGVDAVPMFTFKYATKGGR